MINRVVLVGRLTKDADLRYTPNGVAVANFTLAVNRPFKNQSGENEADFIRVVVWKKQAENAAKYLSKGSLAGIDGRLQTRSYDDKEGRKVYVSEVVADSVQFLEPKNTPNSNASNQMNHNPSKQSKPQQGASKDVTDPFGDDSQAINIQDDDLPF